LRPVCVLRDSLSGSVPGASSALRAIAAGRGKMRRAEGRFSLQQSVHGCRLFEQFVATRALATQVRCEVAMGSGISAVCGFRAEVG